MGILEAFFTLIAVAIAIVVAIIPFEIISRLFDLPKKPKAKHH